MMAEVRPIDANAIVSKIIGIDFLDYGCMFDYTAHKAANEALNDAFRLIGDAPTLDYEPVRHGKWEWYEEPYDSRNPDGDFGWRCSECKADLAAELTLGIPEMHYAYDILDDPDKPPKLMRCVFCGAKMDGGEENGGNA